jgi:hypothetical protein
LVYTHLASIPTANFVTQIVPGIHGKCDELRSTFETGGFPPAKRYLFLGDYAGAGVQSLRCIAMLCAYKIRYPANIFLLRGKHDDARGLIDTGFDEACETLSDGKLFMGEVERLFAMLPAAALVGNRVFAVHSGPSHDLHDILGNISRLPRLRGVSISLELSQYLVLANVKLNRLEKAACSMNCFNLNRMMDMNHGSIDDKPV